MYKAVSWELTGGVYTESHTKLRITIVRVAFTLDHSPLGPSMQQGVSQSLLFGFPIFSMLAEFQASDAGFK